MGRIAIFGATSGIARATSREFMRLGRDIVLIGRDPAALQIEAGDLAVRFNRKAPIFQWDLRERDLHASRFADLIAMTELDGVFFAAGVLFPETVAEANPDATRLTLDINLTEMLVVLNLFAAHFKQRRAGFLSALSSVAGDRGRAANKTYGASKAGLSAYLEGLRSELHDSGVLVQTVKPGPTRTPMTIHHGGPGFLFSSPETVARCIVRGLKCRRTTVYAPGYWRWILFILRCLPEFLMRKVPG